MKFPCRFYATQDCKSPMALHDIQYSAKVSVSEYYPAPHVQRWFRESRQMRAERFDAKFLVKSLIVIDRACAERARENLQSALEQFSSLEESLSEKEKT